jgi:hypothetical protein
MLGSRAAAGADRSRLSLFYSSVGQQACEGASENILTADVLTGRVVVLTFIVMK